MADYVYVRKEYFEKHRDFVKMLDSGNPDKQSRRTYLFVNFEFDGNNFCIPLRGNLKAAVRPYGKIGFPVPSGSRPDAGLDYRYIIIVNDEKYLERHEEPHIPKAQRRIIDSNYNAIVKEASEYIKGFIRSAKKNRIQFDPRYRESSLINFVDLLR